MIGDADTIWTATLNVMTSNLNIITIITISRKAWLPRGTAVALASRITAVFTKPSPELCPFLN